MPGKVIRLVAPARRCGDDTMQGVGGVESPQLSFQKPVPKHTFSGREIPKLSFFARAIMERGLGPEMLDFLCRQCGASFTAPRKRRGRHPGFCGAQCRRVAADARRRAWRDTQPLRPAARCGGRCAYCNTEYKQAVGVGRPRCYCSDQCRHAAWNAKRRVRSSATAQFFDTPGAQGGNA